MEAGSVNDRTGLTCEPDAQLCCEIVCEPRIKTEVLGPKTPLVHSWKKVFCNEDFIASHPNTFCNTNAVRSCISLILCKTRCSWSCRHVLSIKFSWMTCTMIKIFSDYFRCNVQFFLCSVGDLDGSSEDVFPPLWVKTLTIYHSYILAMHTEFLWFISWLHSYRHLICSALKKLSCGLLVGGWEDIWKRNEMGNKIPYHLYHVHTFTNIINIPMPLDKQRDTSWVFWPCLVMHYTLEIRTNPLSVSVW